MISKLEVLDWGKIDYRKALDNQLSLVEDVRRDASLGYLICCEHPSVITLGRQVGAEEKDGILRYAGCEVLSVERGGRATYHGPGQQVIYPVIHLQKSVFAGDIFLYLRYLEKSVSYALEKIWGIKSDPWKEGLTGVWVEGKKVASIGIAVKRWVTYHGLAINLRRDPLAFKGINPCGFSEDVMTSVENLLEMSLSSLSSLDEKYFIAELVSYLSSPEK